MFIATKLTVTTKGQVTLRKELLAHLGVQPGQQLVVERQPDGRIALRAAKPAGDIADIFGCLKRDGGPVLSIEAINAVTEAARAGQG
jgi:AbrB family looped-hinge helix DNA binding protein